jgi:hypothetical protein
MFKQIWIPAFFLMASVSSAAGPGHAVTAQQQQQRGIFSCSNELQDAKNRLLEAKAGCSSLTGTRREACETAQMSLVFRERIPTEKVGASALRFACFSRQGHGGRVTAASLQACVKAYEDATHSSVLKDAFAACDAVSSTSSTSSRPAARNACIKRIIDNTI